MAKVRNRACIILLFYVTHLTADGSEGLKIVGTKKSPFKPDFFIRITLVNISVEISFELQDLSRHRQ